jgi:hypothetical protein
MCLLALMLAWHLHASWLSPASKWLKQCPPGPHPTPRRECLLVPLAPRTSAISVCSEFFNWHKTVKASRARCDYSINVSMRQCAFLPLPSSAISEEAELLQFFTKYNIVNCSPRSHSSVLRTLGLIPHICILVPIIQPLTPPLPGP